ncbi:MAG: HAD hydrolase-like protein [Lentisphaeria bacterium]|jgi:HAD superfamily hydrolase (TIGR01450 family)
MGAIQPSFHDWFRRHQDELDALVCDIDGVLAAGGAPLPGSRDFVRELRSAQFPIALLTNDGNHSVAEKARFLNRHGFDFREEEITSCADGLVEAVRAAGLAGQLFFIVGDLGEPCFAAKAGLRTTRDLARLPECAGVIVGEENYDWAAVINGVLNFFIRNPAKPFFVPNPDEYYPARGGTINIAAGGVARFIQRVAATYGVSSLNPVYLGKPYQPIFAHSHAALEGRLGHRLRRHRVLMLGDSLAADIQGANDFGYRSGLLLTGITREQHLPAHPSKPELVFRGF